MAHIPYGYRIENGLAVPDPAQAEKLRAFVRMYLEGASASAAHRALGIEVSAQTLYRLLERETYLGTDYYPPLLDRETWERIREAHKTRTHPGTRSGQPPLPVQEKFRLCLPDRLPDKAEPEELFRLLYQSVRAAKNGQKHLTAAEEKALRSLVAGSGSAAS